MLRVFLTVLATTLSLNANAMGSKEPDVGKPAKDNAASKPLADNGARYTWRDGDKLREAVMAPQLIAEFNAVGQGATVKAAVPDAKEAGRSGGVRLWQIDGDVKKAAQDLSTRTGGKYSPVFQEGGAGRKMALPGGVIATFADDTSAAEAKAWAQKNGVKLGSKLNIGSNSYLVETDPGVAALDTAARLQAAGGVKSVTPNWWMEVTTR